MATIARKRRKWRPWPFWRVGALLVGCPNLGGRFAALIPVPSEARALGRNLGRKPGRNAPAGTPMRFGPLLQIGYAFASRTPLLDEPSRSRFADLDIRHIAPGGRTGRLTRGLSRLSRVCDAATDVRELLFDDLSLIPLGLLELLAQHPLLGGQDVPDQLVLILCTAHPFSCHRALRIDRRVLAQHAVCDRAGGFLRPLGKPVFDLEVEWEFVPRLGLALTGRLHPSAPVEFIKEPDEPLDVLVDVGQRPGAQPLADSRRERLQPLQMVRGRLKLDVRARLHRTAGPVRVLDKFRHPLDLGAGGLGPHGLVPPLLPEQRRRRLHGVGRLPEGIEDLIDRAEAVTLHAQFDLFRVEPEFL